MDRDYAQSLRAGSVKLALLIEEGRTIDCFLVDGNKDAFEGSNLHIVDQESLGRFHGIGYEYCLDLDRSILPQPFPSWTFDECGKTWRAPITRPPGQQSMWSERQMAWMERDTIPEKFIPRVEVI